MSSPTEPPPFNSAPQAPRRFQFNTATLLGLMAFVAVVCAVGMVTPGLLAAGIAFLNTAVIVAFTAFLVVGVVRGEGDRRLFAIAAATCLFVSLWGDAADNLANYFFQSMGLSSPVSMLVWAIVNPLQHIGLSLFGGWVALRAAKFWRSDEDAAGPAD